MQSDLIDVINSAAAIDPAAALDGDGTLTSEIIDRSGYESVGFLIVAGTLTDGDYTCTLYEDDDPAMGTRSKVLATDLLGQTENDFVLTSADSSQVVKVGSKGLKRYVQLEIVQSSSSDGGFICAVALQGNPRFSPTAAYSTPE